MKRKLRVRVVITVHEGERSERYLVEEKRRAYAWKDGRSLFRTWRVLLEHQTLDAAMSHVAKIRGDGTRSAVIYREDID